VENTHIVLIRGIGAASHALITMKQLEAAVQGAGLTGARSVLATGNFVVNSSLSAARVANKHSSSEAVVQNIFDRAMRQHGLERPIVMRNRAQLEALHKAGASHTAIAERPSKTLIYFFQAPVQPDAVSKIMAKASFEHASLLDRELLIDYHDSVSASKLTLEFIERCAGSIGTARNWNTVQKLLVASDS
jgi:uncharacterized protein (DUF1697 family)